MAAKEVTNEAAVRKAKQAALGRLRRDDWTLRGDLTRRLHRMRDYLDEALRELEDDGQVVSEEFENRGKAGRRYRRC